MSLLDVIKDDALIDLAPALVPFLQNAVAAKGDPLKTGAAWMKFMGDITQAGVQLEGDLIVQIGAVVNTKVMSLLTQAQADLQKQLAALSEPPPAAPPPSTQAAKTPFG